MVAEMTEMTQTEVAQDERIDFMENWRFSCQI